MITGRCRIKSGMTRRVMRDDRWWLIYFAGNGGQPMTWPPSTCR